MILESKRSARLLGCMVIALTLAACGGSSGGPLGPSTGTFNTGGTVGGGSGGGGFGGNTASLQGGVLATFRVGNDQFRAWFADGPHANQLVAAFSGAGVPITSICTDVVPGSGRGGHNEPWRWSVSTQDFRTFFNTSACAVCNNPFRTPAQIENNVLAGTYNCKLAPPVGTELSLPAPPFVPTRYNAFMNVVLVDVQDFR